MSEWWDEFEGGGAAAPAAKPKSRGIGERFTDSYIEAALHNPIGAEGIVRAQLKRKGYTADQINAVERRMSDMYARKRAADPNYGTMQSRILGQVVDLAGGMLGGVDPTYVLGPGKTAAQRIAAQSGINLGQDVLSQGIELKRGVRDKFDPREAAFNAAAGAVFQGGSEAGRSVNLGRKVRSGSSYADWEAVNHVIVNDLEGGGSYAHPKTSPKGAMGPQQVMPETARKPGFGIRPWDGKSQQDLARVGRQYSAVMMDKYDGDVSKVLAAYNAGPGRVDGLIKKHGDNWKDHLPSETQAYVAKGLSKFSGPSLADDPEFKAWSEQNKAEHAGPSEEEIAQAQSQHLQNMYDSQKPIVEDNNEPLAGLNDDDRNFVETVHKGMDQDPDFVHRMSEEDLKRYADIHDKAAEKARDEAPGLMDAYDNLNHPLYVPDEPTVSREVDDGIHGHSNSDLDNSLIQIEDTREFIDAVKKAAQLNPRWQPGNLLMNKIKETENRVGSLLKITDWGKSTVEGPTRGVNNDIENLIGKPSPVDKTGALDRAAPNPRPDLITDAEWRDMPDEVRAKMAKDAKMQDNKGLPPEGQEPDNFPVDFNKDVVDGLKAASGGGEGRLPPNEPPRGGGDEPPPEEPPSGGPEMGPTGPNTPKGPYDGLDPEEKLLRALKEAKPISAEQRALHHQARSEQAGYLRRLQQEGRGLAGHKEQMAALRGELPRADFESFAKHFTDEDMDTLLNRIDGSNRLMEFEKINAKNALLKLLGAEGAKIPTPHEIKLLSGVLSEDVIRELLNNRSFAQKFWGHVSDGINLPRTIMASFDLSAPFRQGLTLIGTKEFWKAYGQMFKYFGSQKAYDALTESIKDHPNFKLARKAGLSFTDMGHFLSDREEQFLSRWAEKIPGVHMSNRAYTGFLNKLRFDTFNKLVELGQANGANFGREGPSLRGVTDDAAKEKILQNRAKDAASLKRVAAYVNAATGRGSLGKYGNAAGPALASVFFSPRLIASRLQMMNPATYAALPPGARKEAMKNLLTFVGTASTLLGLAAAGGYEVSTDSNSSDFLKIKDGNTRYDILGGFQQYMVLASRIISGKTTTGKGDERDLTSGKFGQDTRLDVLERFGRGKLNPAVAFGADALAGSNVIGEKFDPGKNALKLFIPLAAQDMADVIKEHPGHPEAGVLGIPAIFGVGVQTYKPRPAKAKAGKEDWWSDFESTPKQEDWWSKPQ